MSRPPLRLRRLLPATIVAAVTAIALVGCAPGALAPSETPDASGSPTATATSEPSETPGATDQPVGTEPAPTALPTTPPVAGDLPCTDVFTADQLYDFNPNFAPSNQQGQLPGTIRAIADAGGTVCLYEHVTGSDRLVIAVQQDPSNTDFVGFETIGDEGVATTRENDALISVASVYFVSERDAQPIIDDVAANLG